MSLQRSVALLACVSIIGVCCVQVGCGGGGGNGGGGGGGGTDNQAPQVNAGADQTVVLPAGATLDGTVTDDGLPNPPAALTLTWSLMAGPGTVTFDSPNAADTTAQFTVPGTYLLRLTATDGSLQATDDVTVTVQTDGGVNQAPHVEAGAARTVYFPAPADLTGTVTDDGLPDPPAATTATWSMVAGPGNVVFGDSTSPTTTADFSAVGIYVLRLTANDGALQASDEVVVTVMGGSASDRYDLVFLHHSVGENWLNHSLRGALEGKAYIAHVNDITYGTDVEPDTGRPDSLSQGDVPGEHTDMRHWVQWFNDYLGHVRTYNAEEGVNRIIMFKSCFPNGDIWSNGAEPGYPFTDDQSLANYRAVFRHPNGPGNTYTHDGSAYWALEDIFAANPATLFIYVTFPPEHYSPDEVIDDDAALRARSFNNWVVGTWLPAYNAAHPALHNVAVFDLFDAIAYPDDHATHPNRLRAEYGGTSGDSHPNGAANALLTQLFATNAANAIDTAWAAFPH